ncbi:MAG: hypothetical protein AAFR65_09970 [Pseudomonadota bacterium]
MSGLSDAFSFADYKQALSVQSMMAPSDVGMLQSLTLGGLVLGIVALTVISLIRRSGTAFTGILLLASVAVSQALLYGMLDFLTDGMMVLASALAASALLLFVNAVLHTAQGNRIVAVISAIAIVSLISLAGLTLGGADFAAEASFAAAAVNVLAVALLVFAIQQDPRGNGILGFSLILALLATTLMTPTPVQFLEGFAATVAPIAIMTIGVLIATLSAPFVGEDLSLAFAPRDRAPANDAAFAAGASLFADDDDAAPQPRPAMATQQSFHEQPVAEPAPQPVHQPQHEPAPSYSAAPSEPVSSYWHQDSAGGPMLEVAQDEYVWDALAQPEVRAGQTILDACGAATSIELTPEGLRGRLTAEALPLFDDQVLGGGDPVSGPFDVVLSTHDASFRLTGRRQVDHDGILMRLDATMTDVQALRAQPVPAAVGFATASATEEPAPTPAPVAAPTMTRAAPDPVVRLSDEVGTGFEIDLRHCGSSPEEVRDAVDVGAARLAQMLADDSRRGPFAVIDTAGLNVPPGTLASAVGKAVRAHKLPKGALLVALDPGAEKKSNQIEAQASDIQRAGGGVALLLREASASKAPKFQPNMLWISALDVPMGKHGPKKGVLTKLSKKLGAPVLVADVKDRGEAAELHDAGATFGLGRAFKAEEPKPQAPTAPATDFSSSPEPEAVPPRDQAGLQTSLRARGLR